MRQTDYCNTYPTYLPNSQSFCTPALSNLCYETFASTMISTSSTATGCRTLCNESTTLLLISVTLAPLHRLSTAHPSSNPAELKNSKTIVGQYVKACYRQTWNWIVVKSLAVAMHSNIDYRHTHIVNWPAVTPNTSITTEARAVDHRN